MKRKLYISPQFEWLAVTFPENILEGSQDDYNDNDNEDEDGLLPGEEQEGEETMPEVNETVDWDEW